MSLDFTPHDRTFRKIFGDPKLARQLIAQGKKIGREEGMHEGKRESLLEVIEERFDPVPAEVTDLISGVNDDKTLGAMLRVAARAQTVEQLKRGLDEARRVLMPPAAFGCLARHGKLGR